MGIVEETYRLQIHRFDPTTYKHHNTIRFLIGIAPQGAIIFISQGWGARMDIRCSFNRECQITK